MRIAEAEAAEASHPQGTTGSCGADSHTVILREFCREEISLGSEGKKAATNLVLPENKKYRIDARENRTDY